MSSTVGVFPSSIVSALSWWIATDFKIGGIFLGIVVLPIIHKARALVIYDLGFDADASKTAGKITGVEADGPAFSAGLRDGQALKHVSISRNQPDRIAEITIQTDGGPQTIKYYPRGKMTVPQYKLDEAAYTANADACRKPFLLPQK